VCIDEELRRPALVRERVPRAELVVLDDGVAQALSAIARCTFDASFSNANSGVWTPTTVRPCAR